MTSSTTSLGLYLVALVTLAACDDRKGPQCPEEASGVAICPGVIADAGPDAPGGAAGGDTLATADAAEIVSPMTR